MKRVSTVSESSVKVETPEIRMLVVNDNPIILSFLKVSFIKHFSVETAENGFSALQRCQQVNFDIILMDINMSIMDGFKAAECIYTQSQVKPLIYAFTADYDPATIRRVNESKHFHGHLAELNQDSIEHLRRVALKQKGHLKKRMRR